MKKSIYILIVLFLLTNIGASSSIEQIGSFSGQQTEENLPKDTKESSSVSFGQQKQLIVKHSQPSLGKSQYTSPSPVAMVNKTFLIKSLFIFNRSLLI